MDRVFIHVRNISSFFLARKRSSRSQRKTLITCIHALLCTSVWRQRVGDQFKWGHIRNTSSPPLESQQLGFFMRGTVWKKTIMTFRVNLVFKYRFFFSPPLLFSFQSCRRSILFTLLCRSKFTYELQRWLNECACNSCGALCSRLSHRA